MPSQLEFINQYTQIVFEFRSQVHKLESNEVIPLIDQWKKTAGKVSLQFERVVICRSVVSIDALSNLCHAQTIWHGNGPFSADQIIYMMSFDPKISQEAWIERLNQFNPKEYII